MLSATSRGSAGTTATGVVAELLKILPQMGQLLTCGGREASLDVLVERDLTFSQVRCVLAVADRDEPVAISELAAQLNLSVAAAGRNVDALVREGLLDREEDAQDRRTKLISLSPNGEKLMTAFVITRQDHIAARLHTVDEADLDRLLAALRPIIAQLTNTTHHHLEDPA